MKNLLALGLLLFVVPAFAQSVQQSGSVTPGHAAMWTTNGVIQDAGSAASGGLTSLGVTNNGGPGFCINSAPITGPYTQLCFSTATGAAAQISTQNFGGASPQGLTFSINGATQGFPVVSPLPVTINDTACFANTGGGLKDCGSGAFPGKIINCTGTAATDTAALAAALAAGGYILVNGACVTNTELLISQSNTGLFGITSTISTISSNSASATVLGVSAGLAGIQIGNLGITRSVTATGSADGIYFAGICSPCQLFGLEVQNHVEGIVLSSASYSTLTNSFIHNNSDDGLFMQNTASSNALQWYLEDLLLESNGNHGMAVVSAATGSPVTLGDWTGIRTFSNTSTGVVVAGNATVPINGVRMKGGFLGDDGGLAELYLDTFGGQHQIVGTFIELNTAANGIEITGSNNDVVLSGVVSVGNLTNGLKIDAATAGVPVISWTGGRIATNSGSGILAADCSKLSVTGAYFSANTTANITCTANASSLIAAGNNPNSVNTPVGTNGQLFLGITGSPPAFATMSQDCTITNAGVTTCTKTNNVAFTTTATAAAGQLPATATNDNATAGNVGEYISSTVTSGSPVSLMTGTPLDMTTIILTAGDWDVEAIFGFTGGTSTTVNYLTGSINPTTGGTNTLDQTNGRFVSAPWAATTVFNSVPSALFEYPGFTVRVSLSSTTTIHAVAQAGFAASTCSVFGVLRARRVR